MTFQLLAWGLAVGACASFPLGPMGMICIQRVLSQGARSGLATAAGVSLAAALWCVAAVQGLGLLADRVSLSSTATRLVLGSFLVLVAIRNLRGESSHTVEERSGSKLLGQFFTTLLLVLANPATLLTVTAVLAASGLGEARLSFASACGLSLAVWAGGLGLWLCLAQVLMWWRRRLGEDALRSVRRGLGICTLALGLAYLAAAIGGGHGPAFVTPR